MTRMITVKGTGNVSAKPDLIVITATLESHRYDYDETMELAAKSIADLQTAIQIAGLEKKDLKTTSFHIRTHYESYRDKDNNYKSKFDGYLCEQGLKLEIDFDTVIMSKVLSAIAKSPTDPHNLNIHFSVKDKNAISEDLLISATENAKRKAEILAKASGVTLGQLINIDYNWGELHLFSPTNYEADVKCMSLPSFSTPDIEPDDIDVSDTVTFVWEIN